MRQHFQKQWFLLSLLAAICLGYVLRAEIAPLASLGWFRSIVVVIVMFLMGLPFSIASLIDSIRNPKAAVLAVGLNVICVPAIALPLAWMLPSSLAGGLIVAAAVPCTLASASLWTRRAGGDDSVSMLVTVITNLACFLIAPLTLLLILGQAIPISFWDQVVKLALLVVAPLTLAQLLRRSGRAEATIQRHRVHISTLSQIGILVMVVMGMAATSLKATGTPQETYRSYGLMILFAALIHLCVLFAGYALAASLRLGRPQRIAVAISGSQKTLMVGLQITIDCGVSLLPMIAYHVFQLVFDTVWADWLAASKGSKRVDDA